MFKEVKAAIVGAINVKEDEVVLEANLRDDLGIDSLDAVELVMELEDTFGVKIEDAEAQKFVTVKDIVDFIETVKKG